MDIKSTEDLKKAIEIAKNGSETEKNSIIYDIARYKWYNYYNSTHVKEGSETDKANEKVFDALEEEHLEIHELIETRIDGIIAKINLDID